MDAASESMDAVVEEDEDAPGSDGRLGSPRSELVSSVPENERVVLFSTSSMTCFAVFGAIDDAAFAARGIATAPAATTTMATPAGIQREVLMVKKYAGWLPVGCG